MEMQKKTLEELAREFVDRLAAFKRRIIICQGTGCIANGATKLHDALVFELKKAGQNVAVVLADDACGAACDVWLSKSGCQGFCQKGPLVRIEPEGIFYAHVSADDAAEIVNVTILGEEVIDRLLYVDPVTNKTARTESEIDFYSRQTRIVLANATIEPDDVREYIHHGGYFGAREAIRTMTPEEVCQRVIDSGLRGRGGGGFPTGLKWKFALASRGPKNFDHNEPLPLGAEPSSSPHHEKKYVICNGDEGDPGAFMDRSVMEGNPHAVFEGMMIAGRAIGADEGVIYVRAEYPLAVERLRSALAAAESHGLLGEQLFGADFSFRIRIMEGAGAFVCGEETALIASIEGKRGMPMPKPPFPAQSGLYGKPTVINNVETLASIPFILREGSAKYRSYGTEKSPGTKTFALTGHVLNTGLIEVPFGATLRQIVYEIGGGVTDNAGNVTGEDFKSVQIGGPSGGCLTPDMLDMSIDFDSLKSAGAMVGSGGLVVMNNETCMVKIARFFMKFTQNESCGKCVPCREGTRQMLALLDDIIEGRADASTLSLLEQTAQAVQIGSLCGLGKTAPNPVLSTLRYFRDEYVSHGEKKICPTGECKALALPEIDSVRCKGCTACLRKCPVGAITGKLKEPHRLDATLCIKCGVCKTVCKFHAVVGL